jgi:hypothetical protein
MKYGAYLLRPDNSSPLYIYICIKYNKYNIYEQEKPKGGPTFFES